MQHVIQISKEVLEINLYFLYLRSPNVSVQRRGSTPLGERRRTRSASPAITDTTRVAVGSVQAALHKRWIPFKIFAQVGHETTYAAIENHHFFCSIKHVIVRLTKIIKDLCKAST